MFLIFIMIAELNLSHEIPCDFQRVTHSPVISTKVGTFQSAGAFNPAVVYHKGRYVMLYRAQDEKGISRIGYAQSKDGIHFTEDLQPLLTPAAEYENAGLEDPRLLKIGRTYYLTYTGYNGKDAQLCLATSRDLRTWKRQGIIMPANKGSWNVHWTKSGAIIPRKIAGRYWMFYMGDAANGGSDQIGVASSSDLLHWADATSAPLLARRPGKFDSVVVEPGPPPLLTSSGVLLIYNGADDKLAYRTGWALFDKNNPSKLLARSAEPVFSSSESWEKTGQVPNVVFMEGLVKRGDRYLIYYGAADKNVGLAEFKLVRKRL